MENKDKCVMCGVETPYDVSTHVDYRYNYVDGIGQMCANCHRKGSNPIEHEELINTFFELAYDAAQLAQDQHDEDHDPASFLFWHRVKIYIRSHERK